MKILIVEDDVNSRIYLERALLSQGYLVQSAVNGVEAIEKAKQSPPDLIISDIMMPEMDGFELCRRVKADEQLRTIPFVFYSATYIEPKDENLAMALGASRFLIKPMELDNLFTAIKSVIDEHVEKSLEVPIQPLAEMKDLDRMQLEVLTRKLDKKVLQLEEEREVSRRRENKYRKLLESMMDGFAYVDMDGMIREYNETYKKMLGYDDEELKHITYTDITPEKWHGLEQIIIQEQVLVRGFSDIYEKEYRRKDGTIFPVELHTFLIKNEQGENEGMWTIVRDITERKKFTQERARMEQQLSQVQKLESLGRLAGGVAHDYNNMLSIIIGYAEMALGKLEPSDPLHKDIDQILESARKSAGLTRQLLAMARKQSLDIRPLNLNVVINNFMKLIQRTLREDVEIQTCLAQNLMVINGDIGQIEQVIMNLAVNAQDAMPDGGKLIIETGDIYLDEAYVQRHPGVDSGPYVMMTISDTGGGMDPKTVENIFEPFFTTKETGKGTGLGLSTVYGIVKQHGGSIWVHSEPSQGTRFTIFFPAKTTAVPNNLPSITSVSESKGNETILFVEDQDQVRQMACRMLARLGYTVLEASSGKAALEIVKSHGGPIHLMVTDVIMPEMNGRQLYECLAKIKKDLKVLYTSGYAADIISHRGVINGSIKFIQKPFTVSEFASKVRKVIDGE